MTDTSVKLRSRANAAHTLLIATRNLLADMEIKKDERSVVVLPLVLASMDTAGAMYSLLANRPEQYWVSAVALRRTQMEYVMRAAFFAKAANERELERFRKKGQMPKRASAAGSKSRAQSISLAQIVSEACQQLGWDEAKLLSSIKNQFGELSSLIHGGKEVLAIYTMNPGWGDVTIDWNELSGELEDAMVFVQLGLALGMYLSPMKPELLSELVRPIYDRAHAFFGPNRIIE